MKGPRRRLPPLGAIRAFEAAARHLSFTHAAEELYVTPGAISHQVRDLERYLGCTLFRRLHRRIVLTEAGEALFAKAHVAFDLLEMTTTHVVTAYTGRPLVVSCIATFSMRWLMPCLHQFTARYPDIKIHLCAPDSPVEFPRDDIDVFIRAGLSHESAAMEHQAFPEEAFGPVCSPALIQRCSLVHPEDPGHHTLLHTETRKQAWPDWLRLTGVTGVDPTTGQRFETFYFLLQAAASGFGIKSLFEAVPALAKPRGAPCLAALLDAEPWVGLQYGLIRGLPPNPLERYAGTDSRSSWRCHTHPSQQRSLRCRTRSFQETTTST